MCVCVCVCVLCVCVCVCMCVLSVIVYNVCKGQPVVSEFKAEGLGIQLPSRTEIYTTELVYMETAPAVCTCMPITQMQQAPTHERHR